MGGINRMTSARRRRGSGARNPLLPSGWFSTLAVLVHITDLSGVITHAESEMELTRQYRSASGCGTHCSSERIEHKIVLHCNQEPSSPAIATRW